MTSPDPEHIMRKFGLSDGSSQTIFGSDCVKAAAKIEANYRRSNYDHRPLLPNFTTPDCEFYLEQYRIGYACFKREVAKVLQPGVIAEIGLGVGTSAMAFMNACPGARFNGFDCNEAHFHTDPTIIPTEYVGGLLQSKGYHYAITTVDTQTIDRLPCTPDLIHVDGDHSREGIRHDVVLAWHSEAKWILCDDTRDSKLVAGLFDALSIDLKRGSVDWAYFPDTWTGSILIRTDHRREE